MSSQPIPCLQTKTGVWRSPMMTVARFTLRSYIRSGWILGDLVFVWLLYAAFFLEFGGNAAYFFGTLGQGLGALTILSTIVMVQRSMNARVYLPLARLIARSSYIRGLILASCTLRIPAYLLALLLCGGYHTHAPSFGIQGATFGNLLLGSLGLLMNCFIVAALTVVLSIPISTRRIQIVFLAWLVAVLSTSNNSNPYLAFLRMPLAPLIVCINLGNDPVGLYEILLVIVSMGYVAGLIWLANFWLSKRDLILQ